MNNRNRVAVAIAALLASAGLGAVAGASSAGASADASAPAIALKTLSPAGAGMRASSGGSLADMIDVVGPAVVQIQVRPRSSGYGARFALPDYANRSEGGGNAHSGALGSGFVIDQSGIIVTNNHVVASGGDVLVKLDDGTELAARVLGTDPKTDLAVIKVDAPRRLEFVQWADSDAARVGENVFAVGSPFGLGNSVTAGIISARGREIGAGPYDDFLQVDASINTGNSGGPLFDESGRVVGVNTAIFSPSGGNVGIGFAIPSRLAQSVVRQIVANGEVRRGRIGVALQPLTADIAAALGLPDSKGALIAEVDPAGPASSSGLNRGDVVVAFAGKAIDDSRAFARAVAEATIGSSERLVVVRNGRRLPVEVTISGSEPA